MLSKSDEIKMLKAKIVKLECDNDNLRSQLEAAQQDIHDFRQDNHNFKIQALEHRKDLDYICEENLLLKSTLESDHKIFEKTKDYYKTLSKEQCDKIEALEHYKSISVSDVIRQWDTIKILQSKNDKLNAEMDKEEEGQELANALNEIHDLKVQLNFSKALGKSFFETFS